MSVLNGKRVLVAGAGRGIGRAVAVACSEAGADLVLISRTKRELEETQKLCASRSAAALVAPGDISRPDDVARVVALADAGLGGIDVLVNVAAVHGPIGPAHECDPEVWREALAVNLFGSFLLCRAVVPGMLARGSGRIILFAGGGATAPRPAFSAYAAAKAGVVRLAETLAAELRPRVQVNAVAPGLVDTALLDDVVAAGAAAGADYEQVRAFRRGEMEGAPIELASELVVFLAGAAPPELTGRLISAPHDPWRAWSDASELPAEGLYTLRRLDRHTIEPLLEALR